MERAPLLLLGMLSLLAGLLGGLVRVGWAVPNVPAEVTLQHGALMLTGFLGTLISLEKAVALRRSFGYAAPVLIGIGALSLAAGGPVTPGRVAIALGGLVFFSVLAVGLYERATRWTATQLAGAACFATGALAWLLGRALVDVVPWWAAFIILTVAGERLELSRLLAPTRPALVAFATLVAIAIAGPLVAFVDGPLGARISGLAWLGLAAWLLRWDLARKSLRRPGAPRFLAWAVMSGHVWLALAGVFALAWGAPQAGPAWDAILHALFVGFAFSMIFGHAPIIFPAILRLRIRFTPRFWIHLVLLHVGTRDANRRRRRGRPRASRLGRAAQRRRDPALPDPDRDESDAALTSGVRVLRCERPISGEPAVDRPTRADDALFAGSAHELEAMHASAQTLRERVGHPRAEVLAIADLVGLERNVVGVGEQVERGLRDRERFDVVRARAQVALVPDRGGERVGVADQNGSGDAGRAFLERILLARDRDEISRGPDEPIHAGVGAALARELLDRVVASVLGDPACRSERTAPPHERVAEITRERRLARRLRADQHDASSDHAVCSTRSSLQRRSPETQIKRKSV